MGSTLYKVKGWIERVEGIDEGSQLGSSSQDNCLAERVSESTGLNESEKVYDIDDVKSNKPKKSFMDAGTKSGNKCEVKAVAFLVESLIEKIEGIEKKLDAEIKKDYDK